MCAGVLCHLQGARADRAARAEFLLPVRRVPRALSAVGSVVADGEGLGGVGLRDRHFRDDRERLCRLAALEQGGVRGGGGVISGERPRVVGGAAVHASVQQLAG
jgi:hypothetical protein